MATEAKNEKVETKAEKFIRLASARTEKALNAIATLRGLTNKTNYDYTDEQWAKIFGALEGEMTRLQEAVKKPDAVASTGFSL